MAKPAAARYSARERRAASHLQPRSHYGSGSATHPKARPVIASTAVIHPTALVHPEANIGEHVAIGPFSIIEDDCKIGDHTTIDSHVLIKSGTQMASHNRVYKGAVLGEHPQHLQAPEVTGRTIIGGHNTIRENVGRSQATSLSDSSGRLSHGVHT